jgi:hypothetical protein
MEIATATATAAYIMTPTRPARGHPSFQNFRFRRRPEAAPLQQDVSPIPVLPRFSNGSDDGVLNVETGFEYRSIARGRPDDGFEDDHNEDEDEDMEEEGEEGEEEEGGIEEIEEGLFSFSLSLSLSLLSHLIISYTQLPQLCLLSLELQLSTTSLIVVDSYPVEHGSPELPDQSCLSSSKIQKLLLLTLAQFRWKLMYLLIQQYLG